MWRIDRYLLKELLVPLGVTCGLTVLVAGLSQMIRMANEVSGLGVSVWDLILALPYAMPSFLGMGLPVAYLLALLVAFGRLAEDRELTALAAAGVSTRRLLIVPLVLGVVLTGIGTVMTVVAEPYSIRRLRLLLVSSAADYFARTLTPNHLHDDLPDLMIYFSSRDGQTQALRDIVIADDRQRERPRLYTARSGALDRSEGSHVRLTLEDGELHEGSGKDALFRHLTFQKASLELDANFFVRRTVGRVPSIPELGVAELLKMSRNSELSERDRTRYAIALQRKFSLPAANVLFVLLVFPFATVLSRPSRLRAYLIASLLVAGYFVLAQATESLMGLGLGAGAATWLPNVFFMVVGGALTARRLRQ